MLKCVCHTMYTQLIPDLYISSNAYTPVPTVNSKPYISYTHPAGSYICVYNELAVFLRGRKSAAHKIWNDIDFASDTLHHSSTNLRSSPSLFSRLLFLWRALDKRWCIPLVYLPLQDKIKKEIDERKGTKRVPSRPHGAWRRRHPTSSFPPPVRHPGTTRALCLVGTQLQGIKKKNEEESNESNRKTEIVGY